MHRFQKKDGTPFWVEIKPIPIKQNGKFKHYLSNWADITEHKNMEDELKHYSEHLEELVKEKTLEIAISEQFLRSTIENVQDLMYIKNKDFKYILANDAYCKFLGKEKEEILDKTVYDLYSKEQADDFNRSDVKVVETGSPVQLEDIKLIDKHGTGHILHSIKTPMKDLDGNVTHIIGVARDITERKQLERERAETEQILRSTIANVPDHMYIKDAESRYLYVNDSYCKFHGKTREEIIGKTVYDLYSKEKADLFKSQDKEAIKKGTILTPDIKLTHADGTSHIIQTIKAVLKDSKGNVTHIIGITRDNTERKELERMKDHFISTATHELRTPLVSILGYIDLALEGKSGEISDRAKFDLQVMARNANRLMSLTNDMLDIRRIESDKLQLKKETIDFKEIIEHSIKELRPFITENQTFHVNLPQKPLTIQGDSIRISQILMNLLSNAAKFTF